MIRSTTKTDVPLIKLLIKSVPGFWDNNWGENVIEKGIISSYGLSYVWEENQRILGFICAHDLGFRAYLSELVVAEDARGKNIGKKLLEKVEEELLARGSHLIISDVWKDAVRFYNKLGWTPPDVVLLKKNIKKNC